MRPAAAALLLLCAGCGGQLVRFPFDGGPASPFSVSEVTAASSVPAPDYALDLAGLAVLTDAHGTVSAVAGAVALTAGLITGQQFVVVTAAGLTTYAQLDGAFVGRGGAPLGDSVAAGDFQLVGAVLGSTLRRTLIISNATGGVRSYQAFEITFRPPA